MDVRYVSVRASGRGCPVLTRLLGAEAALEDAEAVLEAAEKESLVGAGATCAMTGRCGCATRATAPLRLHSGKQRTETPAAIESSFTGPFRHPWPQSEQRVEEARLWLSRSYMLHRELDTGRRRAQTAWASKVPQ